MFASVRQVGKYMTCHWPQDQRIDLCGDGLFTAIRTERINEMHTRILLAKIEDGGGNLPDCVVAGDVRRRRADLIHEIAEQRHDELRRDVGGVGVVAMRAATG